MALDLGPGSWDFVGGASFPTGTATALRGGISAPFSKRLVKVEASVRWPDTPGEGERWRRSGWCYQTTLDGLEITSRECYVNQAHLLVFPLITEAYFLGFLPVRWLPNLDISFWQFRGDETQVADELILLMGGL